MSAQKVIVFFGRSLLLLLFTLGAHSSIAFADTPLHVMWDDLAPSTEQYDDPFLEMSYKQKDHLRTILDAERRSDDATLSVRARDARASLAADGYDADALLAQRLVVMQKRREEATGVTGQFLERDVILDGYVLPLRGDKGLVYSFLLVPWVGACIHTPPPPPNQMVRIDVPEGIEVDEIFHAARLRGVLEHAPTVSNLFLVDGQRMVEASYSLKDAQVWGVPGEIKASAAAPFQGNVVARTQAWISNLFTTSMTSMDQGKSLATVAFALFVAFLYGVLHTLGPGHGKVVVISYFAGEGGSLRRGVGMGVRIAIVHVFSAVAAVFLIDLAIRQTTGGAPSDYRLIRLGSYALIIAIGLWMLWKSFWSIYVLRRTASTAHEHDSHHTHPQDHNSHSGCAACAVAARSSNRSDGWLATAVGIVPCTGALIVMLFGFANDLVWPAIAMVAAISLGMAISMSLIGLVAIWSRAKVAKRIGTSAVTRQRFETLARVGGATCVTLVGVFLFVATWHAPVEPLVSQEGEAAKLQGATLSALID
ncbi:HoxN/HupN/NixA family nickel/cobalt transporter [Ruegeria profundi]|uniref:HoxN/HupN/NixA family nickel/cobalt transporter n=1 Tax=Ruegeria profundi TaxID=1685378 RepID=UPI001CD78A94|nr:DUF3299 domain-containing protein [Ruegeria profundi]MCA0930458.1 DUF3299 domain-containing protein [Ruegeria profundi]